MARHRTRARTLWATVAVVVVCLIAGWAALTYSTMDVAYVVDDLQEPDSPSLPDAVEDSEQGAVEDSEQGGSDGAPPVDAYGTFEDGTLEGESTGGANGAPSAETEGVTDYAEACQEVASTASANAQVYYPASLDTRVGVAIDYRLTIDVSGISLPPSTYVPKGEAKALQGFRVPCRLVARLTAGDEYLEVTPESDDGWMERTVNGADLFQWSWSVTGTRPGEHHVTVQIKPVVFDASRSTSSTLELATDITAHGSWIQRLGWWIERQTAAARIIGTALTALLATAVALRKKLAELLKRKPPPAQTPPKPDDESKRKPPASPRKRRTTPTTKRATVDAGADRQSG